MLNQESLVNADNENLEQELHLTVELISGDIDISTRKNRHKRIPWLKQLGRDALAQLPQPADWAREFEEKFRE